MLKILILMTVILSACVSPPVTDINSKMAENYAGQPRKIFVLTDIGSDFGEEFFVAFEEKIKFLSKECGSDMLVSRLVPLELDEGVHARKLKEFGSDFLMSIRRNGGTQSQNTLFHVVYDARVVQMVGAKIVWRAKVDFYRGGTIIPLQKRGDALAIDLIRKMRADGIFKNCTSVETK